MGRDKNNIEKCDDACFGRDIHDPIEEVGGGVCLFYTKALDGYQGVSTDQDDSTKFLRESKDERNIWSSVFLHQRNSNVMTKLLFYIKYIFQIFSFNNFLKHELF